jgi:putative salt-induced outer membrane protein YdiY
MKNILKSSLLMLPIFSTSIMAIHVSDVEALYGAKSTIKSVKGVKQSINFGFSNTTGNTETLNLNGKYKMLYSTVGYKEKNLKMAFDLSLFMTKNNGKKDNEEYTANFDVEQDITDGWAAYFSTYWFKNEFFNLKNKFSVATGLAKELFRNKKFLFKVKLGVSHNIEYYLSEKEGKVKNSFTAMNEYFEYRDKLNDTSSIYLKIGSLQNLKNIKKDYEVLGVAGFDFEVAKSLSLTIEEEVRYDAIPAGKKKRDTKTIIRVGYNF